MSVCATCGRQRTGTAPFCAGCGTRFPDAGAGELTAADALKTEAPESGSAETRWDTRDNPASDRARNDRRRDPGH